MTSKAPSAQVDRTATVDDVVRMAIEDLFPNQTVPDEENYRADRTQFRAPDHSILDGKVLIERKSRNPSDESAVYEKLVSIAAKQGAPFHGLGRVNLRQIIATLPDPTDANRQIVDFMLRQTMKLIQKAKVKFADYHENRGRDGQIRILVISDNSRILEGTAATEHFIGRKMGGYDISKDETGMISAILFVKHPSLTIDEQNSYWFKAVIKRLLPEDDCLVVQNVAALLHHRVGTYGPFYQSAHSARLGRYRPLIA